MREILFRGKWGRTWIYGDLQHSSTKETMYIDNYTSFPFQVVPETVGQFTGLTDKNGNKIFEGDIVKTLETDSNSEQRCFPVVQSHGAFWLYDEFLDSKLDFLGSYHKEALEIIGNIHDNPELLKGT